MTDKKIEDYLERAWEIIKKNVGEPKGGKENTIYLTVALEIAKMIQLEEHRNIPDRQIVDKFIKEWNEEAKRFIEGQR